MINIGNKELKDCYIGNKRVKEIYIGNVKVYPVTNTSVLVKHVDGLTYVEVVKPVQNKSYYVKVDGTNYIANSSNQYTSNIPQISVGGTALIELIDNGNVIYTLNYTRNTPTGIFEILGHYDGGTIQVILNNLTIGEDYIINLTDSSISKRFTASSSRDEFYIPVSEITDVTSKSLILNYIDIIQYEISRTTITR